MTASFSTTLSLFCTELRNTFPELSTQIDRAASLTPDQFWRSWKTGLSVLLLRDSDLLLGERRGFLLGAVRLTPTLWTEISESTRLVIWRYLRTLALEAAMEMNLDGMPATALEQLNAILMAERMEKGGAEAEAATTEMFEESMSHLKPLMEKLKGMMGGFMDISGLAGMKMPEIPERLRNGRIAKLAEDMAKQFRPEEFGIDPALLTGDNVEEILTRLAELYQRDPTLLISGAKRVADKIKTQILGGSLNREELIAEAQEFVALFKEHPLFKEITGKFQGMGGMAGGLASMFGGGGDGDGESSGGASAGAPSERRRAVQERLRKKLAARNKK